jgi:hypothetical protein
MISLLAAFCGGIAWALDAQFFLAVFAVASVIADAEAIRRGMTIFLTPSNPAITFANHVAYPGRR